MIHCQGFKLVNYIDDFIGFGTPRIAQHSFLQLHDLLKRLDISTKKLVKPATEAVGLSILINTIECTIAISQDKLEHICEMVNEWENKKYCAKRQLQFLLGNLLYVHKGVKLYF